MFHVEHEGERAVNPTIILLVGTSSAGKTTLAKHLQDILPDHYLHFGIDDIFRMVSERWGGGLGDPLSYEGFRYDRTDAPVSVTIRYGAIGQRILEGWHRAMAAFARAGNHLIIDDMLLDDFVLKDWMEQIGPLRPYVVKVTAEMDILEQREIRRGNESGLARGHYNANDIPYADRIIETSAQLPAVCAAELAHWLAGHPEPVAIDQY